MRMIDGLEELRAAAAVLAERPPLCSITVAPDLRVRVLRHPEVADRRSTMQSPPPYPPNPFWRVPVYVDSTLPARTWRALDQHGDTYAAGLVAEAAEVPPKKSPPIG